MAYPKLTPIVATGTTEPRYICDRFSDIINVKDYGAKGDGATDDTSAFVAAGVAAADKSRVVFVPAGSYVLSSNIKDSLAAQGVNGIDFYSLGDTSVNAQYLTISFYDSSNATLHQTHADLLRGLYRAEKIAQGGNIAQALQHYEEFFPLRSPSTATHPYNNVFSFPESKVDGMEKCTVFGTGNAMDIASWSTTEVFGNGAMAYAKLSSRNTALGSVTLSWLGAPNQEWLIKYGHDFWRWTSEQQAAGIPHIMPGKTTATTIDGETITLETPGVWTDGQNVDHYWTDGETYEELFPGIGLRLNAFGTEESTDGQYATSVDECDCNVAVGRDAGNHMVKGKMNTFAGYQSACRLFSGKNNTVVGSLAMDQAFFCENNVCVGSRSGMNNNDGDGNVFIGYSAGLSVQGGEGAVIIGRGAAQSTTTANKAIIIGQNAAQSTSNLDNTLFIGNWVSKPAISGDLVNNNVGIDIRKADIRARLHVYTGDSEASRSYNGVLIQGSSTAPLDFECSDSGYGAINFNTKTNANVKGIVFGAGSDSLSFTSGGSTALRMTTEGHFRPGTSNSQNLGASSYLWKDIYAANATIQTSDSRMKNSIEDIPEAVLEAWGSVNFKEFKFNDAVEIKKEKARMHVGVIAQEIEQAFKNKGLNASSYGLFCHDSWDDEYEEKVVVDEKEKFDDKGNIVKKEKSHIDKVLVRKGGDAYSVRYVEALILECAHLRHRLNKIEYRLSNMGM